MKLMKNRKTGKTTRLVDLRIQDFFENGFTFIYEGRGTDSFRKQTDEALNTFRRRLELEHFGVKYAFKFANYEGIECYKVTKHNL